VRQNPPWPAASFPDPLANHILSGIGQAEHYFRLGMEAAGNDVLTGILDNLMGFLKNHPQAAAMDLNPILAEILACQQQRDWIRAADLLYYRLLPWLQETILVLQPSPANMDQ